MPTVYDDLARAHPKLVARTVMRYAFHAGAALRYQLEHGGPATWDNPQVALDLPAGWDPELMGIKPDARTAEELDNLKRIGLLSGLQLWEAATVPREQDVLALRALTRDVAQVEREGEETRYLVPVDAVSGGIPSQYRPFGVDMVEVDPKALIGVYKQSPCDTLQQQLDNLPLRKAENSSMFILRSLLRGKEATSGVDMVILFHPLRIYETGGKWDADWCVAIALQNFVKIGIGHEGLVPCEERPALLDQAEKEILNCMQTVGSQPY